MTIKIILDGKYDISELVTDVALSGDTKKVNRQLEVTIKATTNGRNRNLTIKPGRKVTFRYDGKLRFIGIIFSHNINDKGDVTFTSYDSNVYLTKSTNTYIYRNKKASDIIKTLGKEYGIPLGEIADTGYVIPYLRVQSATLYDLALKALTVTRKQTGKRFVFGNVNGRLTVSAVAKSPTKYVFENGKNILSANYSASIEETITQVRVVGGKKGKQTSVIVRNAELREVYGVMQAFEEMDEKATASQVKQRANALLNERGVVDETYEVEVLGIPEVDVGTAVYIKNAMTGVYGAFYVDSITHAYKNPHTMALKLTRTYELPDIEVDSDELKPEEVKKKKPVKKKVTKKDEKKEATKK